MNSVELYKHNPWKTQPQTDLSSIPLKLDMTDPDNQDAADAAWSKYMATRNASPIPGGPMKNAYDTHRRGSIALNKTFLGFPDADLYRTMTSDMGLRPGQAQYIEVPIGYNGSEAVGVESARDRRARTSSFNDDSGRALPFNGFMPQSLTYMPAGGDHDNVTPFVIAHEATHAWGVDRYPDFHVADGQLTKVNKYGEEPAPHFPEGLHDRQFMDELEADRLNTRFGGYGRPASVPANPWYRRVGQ